MLDAVRLLAFCTGLLNDRQLRLFLNDLGNLATPMDSLNFRQVLVLLYQGLTVLCGRFFSCRELAQLLARLGLPQAKIRIVASADDVGVIHRIVDREHSLHALSMIYLSGETIALFHIEYSYSSIVRPSDELSTGRRPTHGHDCRCVSLVNVSGLIKFSHVKRVSLKIFVRHYEVQWFHRIPLQVIASHSQHCLLHG